MMQLRNSVGLAALFTRAILAAAVGGALLPSHSRADASLPDPQALCSALSLARSGTETADGLAVQAGDEIATVDARLRDCRARPLCAYSPERDALEARARAAHQQLSDLSRLRAVMLDHKRAILLQMHVGTEEGAQGRCKGDR